MSKENACEQCGGVMQVEYIVTFEQCKPHSLRVEPTLPIGTRLCPGHPTTAGISDWEALSSEQKFELDRLRGFITDYFLAAVEPFETQYPDIKVMWNFTIDANLRGG